MAEIEQLPISLPSTPAPLGAPHTQPRSQPRSQNNTGRNTPIGRGRNAEEAILIGSSDDEDYAPAPPRRSPPRPTIQEHRARLHRNRRGTPIPRARENGMRVMSPPPPIPGFFHFEALREAPRMPRPRHDGTLPPAPGQHDEFLAHQLARAERMQFFHILQHHRYPDVPIGSLMDLVGFARDRPGPPPAPAEYNVRMTHARAKPRVGFTYDFAPDEEAEAAAARKKLFEPQPRTRTTIIIPDSPPMQPVDRKGKRRARDEDEPDVLYLSDADSNATIDLSSSPVAGSSSSSSQPRRKRQRRAVEIVEFLSDDESDSPQEKAQTLLVCAHCHRPLRTGGDRLWALRCGHMIDSRCYHKLSEPSEDMSARQELSPANLEEFGIPGTSAIPGRRISKRQRLTQKTSGNKGKAPAPPVPQVIQTLKWKCPIGTCGRIHTSERVVEGTESSWRPAKVDGAIKVYI